MIQTIALEQFNLRRQVAQARVRAQTWTAEEADARLYPWLHIALRCGVAPEALHLELAATLADYRRAGHSDAHARWFAAVHFCDPDDALAELTRARDTALRENNPHAEALCQLAIHLGCPAHIEWQDQKEAA